MYFLFMKKDIRLQIAKKINKSAGFSSGNCAFIIGNSNIDNAEPPQFTIVE